MGITVSIDSMNREILKGVRKSVDIRTIVYNMMRIKAAVLQKKRKQPRWIISAVFSAEIVYGLPDLASYAVAFGASTFQLQDLVEYTPIKDNVANVWALKGDAATRAAKATEEAITIAAEAGLEVLLPPGWMERLKHLQNTASDETVVAAKNHSERQSTYTPIPEKGFTRDCTDPWTFMQVFASTEIRPCCFSPLKIGSVEKSKGGIEGALNSDTVVNLRKGLLMGNLDEYCSMCSFKPMIDVESFQSKIAALTS
jgi:hypothetical protein